MPIAVVPFVNVAIPATTSNALDHCNVKRWRSSVRVNHAHQCRHVARHVRSTISVQPVHRWKSPTPNVHSCAAPTRANPAARHSSNVWCNRATITVSAVVPKWYSRNPACVPTRDCPSTHRMQSVHSATVCRHVRTTWNVRNCKSAAKYHSVANARSIVKCHRMLPIVISIRFCRICWRWAIVRAVAIYRIVMVRRVHSRRVSVRAMDWCVGVLRPIVDTKSKELWAPLHWSLATVWPQSIRAAALMQRRNAIRIFAQRCANTDSRTITTDVPHVNALNHATDTSARMASIAKWPKTPNARRARHCAPPNRFASQISYTPIHVIWERRWSIMWPMKLSTATIQVSTFYCLNTIQV